MIRKFIPAGALAVALSSTVPARAVSSAELYQNQSYAYGRFETRVRFAAGDGVISSFFLWKPGSEMAGTFWNELDFEKLGADCRMQTNPLYGLPVADHGQIANLASDLCGEYHTYAFEWTPTYIAWLIDGVEVRREAGEVAAAFEQNAASGMQIHFNVWPGDATFGGNFNPAILPIQQYISWVQYSSFENGTFVFQWREDFAAGLPPGWSTGNWPSPKNLSTHAPANVTFTQSIAVLSLTADNATGFAGNPPPDEAVVSPPDGAAGGGSSSEPMATGGAAPIGVGGPVTDPVGVGAGGASGTTAPGTAGASNGPGSSAAGAPPANGGTGLGPTLSPERPRARSKASCSLSATRSNRDGRSGGLVAAAAIWLVSRRLRRAAGLLRRKLQSLRNGDDDTGTHSPEVL